MTRIEQMVDMRNNGQTLQAVGDQFGISRERVRQLLKREGYVGKPDLAQVKASPEQKAAKYKRHRARIAAWQKANPEKVRSYRKGYTSRRKSRDVGFRIRHNISSRLRQLVNKHDEAVKYSIIDLLGCTIKEFKDHLEAQFQPGMTWENYGVFGWHIDHIVSCWRFDLTDPEQQKRCFHYTNMQPLWREDNMAKRDHWEAA
jgi:hypothetical protein